MSGQQLDVSQRAARPVNCASRSRDESANAGVGRTPIEASASYAAVEPNDDAPLASSRRHARIE